MSTPVDVSDRPAQIPQRRFRMGRAVSALMLREMASTYGRSPGGYLWMILEPLAGIALLSFVFSLALRAPVLGNNFALFFATGLLPFTFYGVISQQIAMSLNFSRALLAYPAMTFVDALVARFLLNGLTHLLVFVILITGILTVFDLRPILDWNAIFAALGLMCCITISVGTLNCYLMNRFPIWARIWTVLSRPMFIMSGVLFIPENVPAQYRDWFMLNPIPHMTSLMRKGFYATYDAVHVDVTYVICFSMIVGILGLILLLRNHKDLLQL